MKRPPRDAPTVTDASGEERGEAIAVSEGAAAEEAPAEEAAVEQVPTREEEGQPVAPAEDVPAGEGEAETAGAGISELGTEDEPLPEETAQPPLSDEPRVEEESGAEAVAGHGGPLSQSADVRETELAVEVPSQDVVSALPEMDLPVEEGEAAVDQVSEEEAAPEPATAPA